MPCLFADTNATDSLFAGGGVICLVSMVGVYIQLLRWGRTDVTDSPWFWATLFGGSALAALLIIGPKYAKREAFMELRGIGKMRAVPSQSPGIGGAPVEPGSANDLDYVAFDAEGIPLQPPARLIVPLYLLAGILAVAFVYSAHRLIWQMHPARAKPAAPTP